MPQNSTYFKSFVLSSVSGLLAYSISHIYFPEQFEMAVAGLTALALQVHLHGLLEDNRIRIWELKENPWNANRVMSLHLVSLFGGMFFCGLLYYCLIGKPVISEVSSYYKNGLIPLAKHNLLVLLNCLCIALFFRVGGLMLILGWNSIHWAEALVGVCQAIEGLGPKSLVALSISPHLLLELSSYVLAGLSGLFFSKALFKYSPVDTRFGRVSVAALVLLLIGALLCVLAAISETYLAQKSFSALALSTG